MRQPWYVLFAAMGASGRTLIIEITVAGCFLLVAVFGFRRNFWLIVSALVGHGIFDFVHRFLIDNPGVPRWWPGFAWHLMCFWVRCLRCV